MIHIFFLGYHTTPWSLFSCWCELPHPASYLKKQTSLLVYIYPQSQRDTCQASHEFFHIFLPGGRNKKELAPLVVQTVKNLPVMWETWVQTLGWEDPQEEGMAIHFSILACRSPWTVEPGGL